MAGMQPIQDREIGLPREMLGTRYATAYEPYLALEIVERVAQGELLKDICHRHSKMPHQQTFLKWAARVPELGQAYRAARELSAFAMEEEALQTARKTNKSPGTAQQIRAAELLINQLRWSASRRDPGSYGDKQQTQVTVPITIATSLDLGEGKQSAGADMPDIYTIDLKAIEVPPSQERLDFLPEKGERKPWKRQLTPRMAMDGDIQTPDRDRKREKELARKREYKARRKRNAFETLTETEDVQPSADAE